MEEIGKCEKCKFYQGLVSVPNGYIDLMKDKINCFYFGYMELLTDSEGCQAFKEAKEE